MYEEEERVSKIDSVKKGCFDVMSEVFDWTEAGVTALSIIILMFVLIVRLVGVDGDSMYPTLEDKDQLIISHLFYDEPKQGDIVVFTQKKFMNEPLIKRIIAVEGQTVDIDFETHQVIVDGEVLEEDYIYEPTDLFEGVIFPQTVPEDCVFVMGDNRNNSTDSRDTRIGMVNKNCILGRVLFRVYPLGKLGGIEN